MSDVEEEEVVLSKRSRDEDDDGFSDHVSKKSKQEVKEDEFISPQDSVKQSIQQQKNFEPFEAKTMQIKDFCTCISALAEVKDLDVVLFSFAPEGLRMYGKVKTSPIMIDCFWNEKEMFKSYYKCTRKVDYWIPKERLKSLKKKIGKEDSCITFKEITENGVGFSVQGISSYKDGGGYEWDINLFADPVEDEPSEMDGTFNYEFKTPSDRFKHMVDFMDENNKYILISHESDKMVFRGISDTFQYHQSIHSKVEHTDYKISNLFLKPQLKVVSAAAGLHKTLKICYEEEQKGVVLFQYLLDHSDPVSHFSMYVLPANPSIM